MKKRVAATLMGLSMAAMTLAGCSGSVSVGGGSGAEELSQTELEERVTGDVTPQDEGDAVSTSCEGGVELKDGATQDCKITVGANASDVHVTITGEGEDAKPEYVPFATSETIGETAKKVFAEQNVQIDRVSCPKPLDGKVGNSVECTAYSGDQQAGMTAKVTAVDGLRMNMNFQLMQ